MAADKRVAPALLSFGAELRRLRMEAGLNQHELGELTAVSRSYIGQVEGGHTRCRRDFTVRLDKALHSGTTLQEAWDELLDAIKTAKYPRYFIHFPKVEATAIMLRAYEERIVYGLFQTEAYARAMLAEEDDVKARLERQKILHRERPPMVTVVMDETVLYREVGGPEVMREQLEYLLELSTREKIIIQILPIIYIPDLWGTFNIATQPDQQQVAYIAKAYGGETTAEDNNVALVSDTFVTLQSEALNVRDSRALIRKVIDERWT
ncbi:MULTISPECIES: helix-turn-helix domain-containing protein [Actinomadura]|uniref:Helix-turn-helix domain-containing protein n=1 Tax=Actinomadura yumaensis TaxID=111807 RepID=A0ABW2CXH0_9ACTN|nr:helix-turn-helix transcriptional regulator [Actinomadura sp. J1-007]MWK34193.1 helix-turn-helix domain-containing protein [Actinomadura sp. J1-007]